MVSENSPFAPSFTAVGLNGLSKNSNSAASIFPSTSTQHTMYSLHIIATATIIQLNNSETGTRNIQQNWHLNSVELLKRSNKWAWTVCALDPNYGLSTGWVQSLNWISSMGAVSTRVDRRLSPRRKGVKVTTIIRVHYGQRYSNSHTHNANYNDKSSLLCNGVRNQTRKGVGVIAFSNFFSNGAYAE